MKRRVVVTGIGALSPIGNDAHTMWSNAKKGVNGIDYIKRYDTTNLPVTIGGEIKDFDFAEALGRKVAKRNDRFVLAIAFGEGITSGRRLMQIL